MGPFDPMCILMRSECDGTRPDSGVRRSQRESGEGGGRRGNGGGASPGKHRDMNETEPEVT